MSQNTLTLLRPGLNRFTAIAIFTLLSIAHPAILRAQTAGEGTITGTVTDGTGAVIGNATITATNVDTHAEAVRTSSGSGVFAISPLVPGIYTVKVEAKGFQVLVQDNLDVTPLNILGFNPVLKIGSATETVTVTDAPPVLDVDSDILGAVIENSAYSAIPAPGDFVSATQERDPTGIYQLVPGAQAGTDGRLPSLSGTPGHQAALYLDGVPSFTINQAGDNRTVALNVDVDSVDQVQVMTNVPPVEYMGAGAENFTIKSGTLHYHGSFSNFIRNTVFDTYTFNQKSVLTNGVYIAGPKAIEHSDELSATVGGFIPHTAHKVFFFLAYDRFHGRSGTSVNLTNIPTALEEQGDFTQLTSTQNPNALAVNGLTGTAGDPSSAGTNPAFLYDPTTNSCAATCTRTPFQGIKNGLPTFNVIPSSDFSPISVKLQSYLPNYPNSPNAAHNSTVNAAQLNQNYGNQGTSGRDNYNWDWRFDYDVSSRNRISTVGAMGHDVYATNFSNFYNDAPYTTGDLPLIVPKQFDVEDAYTITSHLTNQLKYGYTRFYMPIFAPVVGGAFAPAAFGITNLPGGQGAQDFPNVTFGTSNFSAGTKIALAQWGANTTGQATQVTIPNNYAVIDNVQYVKGRHVVTVGFSYMWEGLNNANPATLSNIVPLHYGSQPTANYIANSVNIDTSVTGLGYASFLLGAADPISNYSLAYAPTQYTRAKLAAPYVEDNWKVTRNLVIDVGLRWDYIPPVHEKAIGLPAGAFTFSYLNPSITNPATGFPGALEFAGNYGGAAGTLSCNCTTPVQTYWKNWGPRIGLIYSFDSKTVVRMGAGVTYSQGGGTGGGQLSGGTGNGQLSFPAGGSNSSGQILGSSTNASSAPDVASGPTAGPSFWLSNNSGYLGSRANTDLFGPGFSYPLPPTPGPATQNLDSGNYCIASGVNPCASVATASAMGYDDPYQSGRAPEYTFYNFGFERSITKDMTINVAYVGSQAHHTFIKGAGTIRGYWANQVNPVYLVALGPLAGNNSKGAANSIPLLIAPATSANVAAVNAKLPGTINTTTASAFIQAANAFPTNSALTIAQLLTAFPQYSSVQDSWGGPNTENYSYNAFQLILNQRLSHGLTFNVNYTFSKDLGDDGAFRSGYALPPGSVDGTNQAFPADRIDRSRTQLDLPEQLVMYGTYKLPFGTAGHMGGNSWLTREVIGGWQLSAVYTYGSGGPVSVTWSGGCTNATPNAGTCFPSLNPAFTGSARQNGSYGTGPHGVVHTNNTIQYLNPNAFQMPANISTVAGFPIYLTGNAPRTAPYGLRAEGNQNLNASVRRSFPLPHETAFVFQADVANVWNKQTWGGPSGGWSPGSSTFGEVGTPGGIRDWQFSGHLNF
jgi:hypothetical protein